MHQKDLSMQYYISTIWHIPFVKKTFKYMYTHKVVCVDNYGGKLWIVPAAGWDALRHGYIIHNGSTIFAFIKHLQQWWQLNKKYSCDVIQVNA